MARSGYMSAAKPSRFGRGMRIARHIGPKLPANWIWHKARDYLDIKTGGELYPWELDKVTDEAIRIRDLNID